MNLLRVVNSGIVDGVDFFLIVIIQNKGAKKIYFKRNDNYKKFYRYKDYNVIKRTYFYDNGLNMFLLCNRSK